MESNLYDRIAEKLNVDRMAVKSVYHAYPYCPDGCKEVARVTKLDTELVSRILNELIGEE